MYTFKARVRINHREDTPPEEFGVLTIEVCHEDTGEIQFIDIFKENLITDAYYLETGDYVEVSLEQDTWGHSEEVVAIRKVSKEVDPSFYQDVDLPGEIHDENNQEL